MAKAPKSTDTKTYLAQRLINHDGELYEAGEEIDLKADQAQQLLDVGAIAEKPAKAEKAPAP